jgi:hypothetical protein
LVYQSERYSAGLIWCIVVVYKEVKAFPVIIDNPEFIQASSGRGRTGSTRDIRYRLLPTTKGTFISTPVSTTTKTTAATLNFAHTTAPTGEKSNNKR